MGNFDTSPLMLEIGLILLDSLLQRRGQSTLKARCGTITSIAARWRKQAMTSLLDSTQTSDQASEGDSSSTELVHAPDDGENSSSQSTLDGSAAPPEDEPVLPPLEVPRFSLLDRFDWRARRVEWGVVALALFIALAFVPQLLNFARRDEYNRALVSLALLWQPIEAAEYRLYDARFTARGKVLSPAIDKIAIVGIDQNSIARMGQWPWPRAWHAQLISKLQRAGARVIAIDIDFSDRQFPIINAKTGAVKLSSGDQALVDAAGRGRVIFGSFLSSEQQDQENAADTQAQVTHLSAPFEELDATTPDVCLAYVKNDSDGRVRLNTFHGIVSGSDLGSMASLATAVYQNRLDGNENTEFYKLLKSGVWPAQDGTRHQLPIIATKIRDDTIYQTPISFYGPAGTIKTHGYSRVLKDFSDADLKKHFDGRIVFVGATAHILKDIFAVPTFQSDNRLHDELYDETEAFMPGVEIHATATAQLLDGQFIRAQSTQSTLLTLFGFTLLSSLWMIGFREWVSRVARMAQARWAKAKYFDRELPGRIHGLVWFGAFAILGALPPIIFWQFAVWLFARHNFWLVAIYPLLAGALSSGLALLMLFVVEAGERAKIKTKYARHVSPDVLEQILSQPEEVNEKPYRTHATVLFSDLEGFTAYSEAHEPEDVVNALNDYMNRMVPIVESHGGSIDKFIGDAIMAYFGAPIPRYDHPSQALLCAVALQEECARFREETGIPFYMRVGVHTGPVIVGYMGAEQRADYTVIGDTVNLASRLEGKNKEFGSWIMCSADTYFAATGVVEAEQMSTGIKGKSQEVEVFLVRGSAGQPEQEKTWGRLGGGPDVRALGENEAPALGQGRTQDNTEADKVLSLPPETPDELDEPMRALPSPSMEPSQAPARKSGSNDAMPDA